jgi:hypothetical protein
VKNIKQVYQKNQLNAKHLQKIICTHQKTAIAQGTIHEVLFNLGYAHHQPNKQRHRTSGIHYEHKQSLFLIHTDWHHYTNGKYLCTILDVASRKTVAAGEFDNKATKNALIVLKKTQRECLKWYAIKAVLTDHNTQFCANKRDKMGRTEHEFEQYLKRQHIRHVLCRVKHPQTNGKLEKLHDLYNIHRRRFDSLTKFVNWYNNRPHGALNLWEAESPKWLLLESYGQKHG